MSKSEGTVTRIRGRQKVCFDYDYEPPNTEFVWPFYDKEPALSRHCCWRGLTLTFDRGGMETSEFRGYSRIVNDFDEFELADPIDFWFEPEPDACEDLLISTDWSSQDLPDPPSGLLYLAMYMEMHREYVYNPTPPPTNPLVGDETESFPVMLRLCYSSQPFNEDNA